MNKYQVLSLAALLAIPAAASAAVVTTNYNVNDSLAWTVTQSGTGSEVAFNYDYSASGIPQAPGTTSSNALRMRANIVGTPGGTGAVQGITASPIGVSLTGYYKVEALVWMNTFGGWSNATTVTSGTGTSQMFGLGGGYSTGTNWRGGAAVGGGTGTWFATSGDGGFSNTSTTIRDVSYFTGSGGVAANFLPATGSFAAGAADNFNAYYTTAFPDRPVASINSGAWASTQSQTGETLTGGIFGMAWHNYVIERINNVITFSIDGTLIATVNTPSSPLDGGTSLTYFDPTSGISGNPDLTYALVASYAVTVPEPTSAALALPALALLARRRRA